MLARLAATFVLALLVSPAALAQNDGVVRVKSAYSMEETLARIKADVTAKGIMHFAEIDQAKLAAGAGIALRPSTLLIFGNPPLGTLFITAKPEAVNKDPHDSWMIAVKVADPSEASDLLDAAKYSELTR